MVTTQGWGGAKIGLSFKFILLQTTLHSHPCPSNPALTLRPYQDNRSWTRTLSKILSFSANLRFHLHAVPRSRTLPSQLLQRGLFTFTLDWAQTTLSVLDDQCAYLGKNA